MKKIWACIIAATMMLTMLMPIGHAQGEVRTAYGNYYYYAQMGTDRSAYAPGQTAYIQLTMSDSYGYAVSGASIHFELYTPDGKVYTADRMTDAYGRAAFDAYIDRSAANGEYTVAAFYANQRIATSVFTVGGTSLPAMVPTLRLPSAPLQPGSDLGFAVEVRTKENRPIQYATVSVEVRTPSGATLTKSAYTDARGEASFRFAGSDFRKGGTYTVRATASGTGFATGEVSGEVRVVSEERNLRVSLRHADSIRRGETLSLTAEVSEGQTPVSGVEMELLIESPQGRITRATATSNAQGTATFPVAMADTAPFGTYKLTVRAQAAGFAAAQAESSFTLVDDSPRALRVRVEPGKSSYDYAEEVVLQAQVTDAKASQMQGATVLLFISGPSGFTYRAESKTDASGKVRFAMPAKTATQNGNYEVSVSAMFSGYEEATAKTAFAITGAPAPTPEPGETFFRLVETDEAQKIIERERKNPNFVLLDVRTRAEYMESHIEGAIQHDIYASDFEDFIRGLDRNKLYMVYCRTQVRSGETVELMKKLGFKTVYWMNGGMTKWLREGRPSVFPQYEKALDVELQSAKTAVKPGSVLPLFIRVKDLQQNPIRKAGVHLEVQDAAGKVLESADVTMGNTGDAEWSYTVPAGTPFGAYKVVAKATYNDFKPGQGIYMFTVGESEDDGFLTFEQREARGDFNHLDKNEYEYASLKKFYGQNILKYRVKDNKLATRTLADLVQPGKKTLLVFGYPGCGPCVTTWKAMGKLSHREYNFIEVVTSVEENVQSTIDFTDKVLAEHNLVHLRPHIFYDAVDLIWGSRLELLTTPNSLFLDEQGRLVNIAGPLDAAKLSEMFRKTFGMKIDTTEVDGMEELEPVDPNAPAIEPTLKLEASTDAIRADETIWFTMRAYDADEILLARQEMTLIVTNPDGTKVEYKRRSRNNGVLRFGLKATSTTVSGTYTFTAMFRTEEGKSVSKKVTFTISTDGAPSADALRVQASASKSTYTAAESATVRVTVRDRNDAAVSGAGVTGQLVMPSGATRSVSGTTDRSGNVEFQISASAKAEAGSYSFRIEAAKSGYTTGRATVTFTVEGSHPSGKSLTYDDRSRNGEFSHLADTDLASKIRSAYGKNIRSYTLYRLDGTKVTVGDLIDGKRPTVIGLGYPGCSACQNSWKHLSTLRSPEFTLVEALTSGTAADLRNTLSRLGISSFASHFHTGGNAIFNEIGASYVPLIVYLDAEGNITNVGYFNSLDELHRIVKTIEGTVSQK